MNFDDTSVRAAPDIRILLRHAVNGDCGRVHDHGPGCMGQHGITGGRYDKGAVVNRLRQAAVFRAQAYRALGGFDIPAFRVGQGKGFSLAQSDDVLLVEGGHILP